VRSPPSLVAAAVRSEKEGEKERKKKEGEKKRLAPTPDGVPVATMSPGTRERASKRKERDERRKKGREKRARSQERTSEFVDLRQL